MKINYQDHESGECWTICPHGKKYLGTIEYSIYVSSHACQRCESFVTMDRENKIVECSRGDNDGKM